MQKTGRERKKKSKKQKLQSSMRSMVLSMDCESHILGTTRRAGPHGDAIRVLTGTHAGVS